MQNKYREKRWLQSHLVFVSFFQLFQNNYYYPEYVNMNGVGCAFKNINRVILAKIIYLGVQVYMKKNKNGQNQKFIATDLKS